MQEDMQISVDSDWSIRDQPANSQAVVEHFLLLLRNILGEKYTMNNVLVAVIYTVLFMSVY